MIAVTGTDMRATVNGQAIPMYEAVKVNKGDEIKFSHFGDLGFRGYLTIAGGIDVPVYLGSKSTCIFGSYGGFEGRKLQPDDEIKIGDAFRRPRCAGRPQDQGRQAAEDGARVDLRSIPAPTPCPTTSPRRAWTSSSPKPSRCP